MTTQVAVIIVNWNTVDLLDRCLRALYASEGDIELEVCLVDNGSSDGSLELMRDVYPQVRVIANEVNVGFARANNQGISATHGEYILLLNSDAFLGPDVVRRLVARMEEYPDTGAMGCRLVYEDGTFQPSCYSFPDLWTEFFQAVWLDKAFPRSPIFGRYLMTYWNFNDFRVVDVVMGAVMMLRRRALDEIGLLDEGFFMYSEEVDLCYRLYKGGWKVRYEPAAQAVHLWGGSSRKVPAETMVRLYQSRTRFFRKHYGHGTASLFKALLWFEGALRVLGGYGIYPLSRNKTALQKARSYRAVLSRLEAF